MKKLTQIYNGIIVILALISVSMAICDLAGMPIASEQWFYPVDNVIMGIFAVDYLVRLVRSKSKLQFIKRYIFDLIAIIPFNAIFSMFRIFRVFRIFRLAKISKFTKLARLIGSGGRLENRIKKFLHTNGLIYVIYINIACIFAGAVAIYLLEKDITVITFGDAIWWAFVTATTVGYGDISPSTGAGRIVAAILMIVGIGLISMLTGTIATYFTSKELQTDKSKRLDELRHSAESLTDDQIEEIIIKIHDYKE